MVGLADSRLSGSDAAVLAAERGEEAAVLAWLEGGGRADATYERDGVSGITLLMSAAQQGNERVVELLRRHGAAVNLQNSDGDTALMCAAGNGHERVVELLIRHGAEVNVQQSDGLTALIGAAIQGHLPIVLCLLQAGADTKLRTKIHGREGGGQACDCRRHYFY